MDDWTNWYCLVMALAACGVIVWLWLPGLVGNPKPRERHHFGDD